MSPTSFLRLPEVMRRRGRGRSANYKDIVEGFLTEPIAIGRQSVAWPEHEVEAINRARLAGKSADEIKQLVRDLHAARKAA